MSSLSSGVAVGIEALTVHRGGRAVLHDLTASIATGRVTGLFGPSGSGKSTLIRAIAGVQSGVHGRLTVLGEEPGSPIVRRALGYMTQAPSVYEDLTVVENVRYFAAIRGADIGAVLEGVQLEAQSHQLVRNLSGGQRARVSLAAALSATLVCCFSMSLRSVSIPCFAATSGGCSASSRPRARRCSSRATCSTKRGGVAR